MDLTLSSLNIYVSCVRRFYYQGMWRQKINASVDFPLEGLDLNHYIHGPEKQNPYHLYAVSVSREN